ncbi:putative QA-SNARE protein [Leptomonas seymouri]|uniref:Putative QA-SNARE protein n=1 Tax=Leptomonas seymouri TaxID=5684 RepID=A0A0N0P3V3_LEPSE|nr:putative QA-SNARE protein [Leptomonas seymouri]|eukprot:KPI84087.1 putative QA-SNARE protein [Leptomonas seymouri]
MSDSSWRRTCSALVEQLQKLEQKVSVIRRITSRRSLADETKKEREEVKKITREANATDVQDIRKTVKLMERFIMLDKRLSDEGRKLAKDAEKTLQEYENACNEFYRKCIDGRGGRGGQSSRAQQRVFRDASDDEAESEGAPLLAAEPPQRVQFERDLYDELMQERQRETSEIADNVRDIHDIFQHISGMVNEQGEQLDVVDYNISAAERATQNASRHLQRAQQYQTTSSRNKLLFVCMMILLIIVCVGLLIN